ncbi:MAG: hypothetical protein WAU45_21270 [Blastocatellia bacterium]
MSQEEKPNTCSAVDSTSAVFTSTRVHRLILAVILTAAAAVYFFTYNPTRFGSSHDDGIYVSTARALATGEGYRIISLPYAPAQTKYPPFYPFLLALIWGANPGFPGNVNAMVSLSAIASLIFLGMTWRYLVEEQYAPGWKALIIVALAAFNWRTVILANSLYTEMIFAALSIAALILAERMERKPESSLRGLCLGLILGLGFLTRSAGVALLAAVTIHYILGRRFRLALLPLGVAGAIVASWIGWCYVNRTTVTGINVAYYTSYLGHLKEVLVDLQAQDHTSTSATLLNVLATNALMLIVFSIPAVCFGLDYKWILFLGFAFLLITGGFIRDASKGWRLLHVYVLCYLALHLFWLPYVSYDRFLIPILPFLLLWAIRELENMASLGRRALVPGGSLLGRASAVLIGLVLIGTASVGLYSYVSKLYLSVASAPLRKEVKPIDEHMEAIEWIKANSEPSDVLICDRDPIYFLYTGRKSAHFLPMSPAIDWQKDPEPIFDLVEESNGKYLVLTTGDFEFKSFKELVESHRAVFAPVFTSANGGSTVYVINAANRPHAGT